MAEHTKNKRGSTWDKHSNRSKPVSKQKKTLNGNYKPNNGKRNRPGNIFEQIAGIKPKR